MKKSNHVPAALLMTLAATALTGCGNRPRYDYSTEVRRCVDSEGRVHPDYECQNRTHYRGSGFYSYPSWVYGGTQSSDGRIRNFRSTPTAGSQIVSTSGRVITRGGFGSSSSSRGGGFFSGWGS